MHKFSTELQHPSHMNVQIDAVLSSSLFFSIMSLHDKAVPHKEVDLDRGFGRSSMTQHAFDLSVDTMLQPMP